MRAIPGDPALDSMSLRKRFLPSHNVGKKKSFLFDQNHQEKTTAIEDVHFFGHYPLIHRAEHSIYVVLVVLGLKGRFKAMGKCEFVTCKSNAIL